MKVTVSATAKTGSLAFRAKTRKAVAGTWENVQKKAGLSFRSWAMSCEGYQSTDIRDTWGWEQIGQEDMQGLLRVNVTRAEQMLKISGMCYGGVRCFIEPLTWEAPLKTTAPPAVEWVEGYEQLGAAAKTACEIAQRHGLGVVLCRRQVGVRKPRQQTSGAGQQSWPRRRISKFLGLPHDAFGEDVIKMAAEAGFNEVEIIECFRWRKGKGWTLRATRHDDTNHLEIKAGDDTTILASSEFGQVDRRVHHVLPGENRVTLVQGQHHNPGCQGQNTKIKIYTPFTRDGLLPMILGEVLANSMGKSNILREVSGQLYSQRPLFQ